MAFCDFCACHDCRTGKGFMRLSHAPTVDGRWICDVCWNYEVCGDANRKAGLGGGPCDDLDCAHRPKLVGPWEANR